MTSNLSGRVAVVIPTYNAAPYLDKLIPALLRQGIPLEKFLIIDSTSADGTAEIFERSGFSVISIPQREFNHGGTRRMAAALCRDADFLLFSTQDAIPSDNSYSLLLDAFEDPVVGLAYGRQLPRPGARAIERHARLFNYPSHSEVRSLEDSGRLGVKTTFCSNSFAAYRHSALSAVDSFPEDTLFAEDQIVAGKMLIKGFKIAYVAEAAVTHSHEYSLREEFKRYFDVGVFHGRNRWLKSTFGRAEGEGVRFVRSEIGYVRREDSRKIPAVVSRTFAKYIGYRFGLNERYLPRWIKRRLSMAAYYWR